ncbi:MAG: DNA-3-methyladenine glycosylase 2 family protein [Planctomycetaceae bacterium]|nr:DNA-3-methyladenine glycosylase 2 family protein [Planctomycetaceae bacterium]
MMVDHQLIQRHFRTADPVLARIVKQVGPVTLKPQRDRFQVLVRSIISQQISTAAARTIRARLAERLSPEGFRPESLARLSIDDLRAVGVSRQKATYMLDLAEKCRDGTVRLSRVGRLSDEEVIAELTQVKGIGRWSAQMFLMFSLGRLDVFPHDDLGIRSAIRQLYEFAELPNKTECLAIGERWRPYATIGSWYCWRFLELKMKPPRS